MLLFPATLVGLTMGQKGTLWLLVWAGCWWLLTRNRGLSAGLLFGLLSLKPTLFFLVPLLMLRYRQWKFLAGATTSAAAIWGLAASLLPTNVWSEFINGVVASTGNYQQHGGYELSWSCNLMVLVQGTEIAELRCLKWCARAIGNRCVRVCCAENIRPIRPSVDNALDAGNCTLESPFLLLRSRHPAHSVPVDIRAKPKDCARMSFAYGSRSRLVVSFTSSRAYPGYPSCSSLT